MIRRRRPTDSGSVPGTHGHTVGHVSLFLPRERILIAGDAIKNVEGLGGSREQFTANAADARTAVSTLAALRPDSILFGHVT